MACKDTINNSYPFSEQNQVFSTQEERPLRMNRLLFGVNSTTPSDDLLQNNITQFDWVVRNKVYPNFWGRNITGENCLTKEEITFLHSKGCKIAAMYSDPGAKETEEQGVLLAKKAGLAALELGIPKSTAIFLKLEDAEPASWDFMKGYVQGMISEGYTPGFQANTDAAFSFDQEYSRGMRNDHDLFCQCLIWATSPALAEYDRITTSHLIHPDNWTPHAPSGTTRNEIAVWQYGKNCHPILDDNNKETWFDIDLVKNEAVILEKMF